MAHSHVDRYPARGQRVAGTTTIYYETVGTGPPLILIHGLGGSRRWWRKNIAALAPHFTVYTIDLIGFGKSRGGRRFVLDEAAAALHEWMAALDLAHASLIGHSMGGRIGAELAVDYPGSLDRLVLVDSPILPFGRGYRRQLLGMAEALTTVPIDLFRVLVMDTLRTGPLTTLQIGHELLRTDIARKLAQLHLPTLVIWGERDTIVPRRLGEELAAQLPQSHFATVARAGHTPMWEQPEAFNQLVLPFLGVAGDKHALDRPRRAPIF
jgi:pimeloyl-ACP methyl ester carboxylesterase